MGRPREEDEVGCFPDRSAFDADELGAVRWNGRVYKEVVAFNAVASLECALRKRWTSNCFKSIKCSQTMPWQRMCPQLHIYRRRMLCCGSDRTCNALPIGKSWLGDKRSDKASCHLCGNSSLHSNHHDPGRLDTQ